MKHCGYTEMTFTDTDGQNWNKNLGTSFQSLQYENISHLLGRQI